MNRTWPKLAFTNGLLAVLLSVCQSDAAALQLVDKAFAGDLQAVRSLIESGEDIIKSCVKATNRLTGTNIKNVLFDSMDEEQGNATNDNLVRLTMNFTAFVILKVD